MTLLDLLRSAWAIQPERLLEIQSIYDTHLRGEKIDIPAIEARLGRPLASEQQEYRIREGGVAVLSVEGVLAPKANLFMRVSGGASTQLLTKQVESAIADPRVRGLILQVDSGGGSALGVPELADTIRELAAVKPIVTVTDGVMASGAYWLGSAANAVFGSGTTVQVGSIGVVMTHNYTPNASGAQTTEITAGRYKRMATTAKPLDEEATAYLQQMVDHIYGVFVDAVAQHRGVSAEAVLEHMADGRVFIGQQAVDAGLLDGFMTVDQVAERMAANPAEFATRRKAQVAASAPAKKPAGARADGTSPTEPVLLTPPATPTTKETTMDLKTLAEQHPDLLATIQADARAAGAKAEQDRVAAVRAQSMKGHEALIERLAADGKTTGPEAAMAVLAAERAAQEAAGKAFVETDAPEPAKTSAAPSDKPKTKAEQAAEAKAFAAEHKVDFITAMKKLGFA
ncbi:S49 family peptidase [Hydrogenophaga sp. NH-16]|uniref:S49 family peptidase n=1 Tax=Hydrogenophaga sp. NH-16 TaxID=2184519 RepID=UPI000FDA00B4|nr:S49 family peptidase [Hydrogenophaga sp. NH-16]